MTGELERKDHLRSREPRRSVLLLYLLGANILWGTSFVATKTALGSFSPGSLMWMRWMVAALVFVPFWRRVHRPQHRSGDWKLLLLAAVCIPCLYYLLEGFALRYTTSGQVGVVSAVYPLLVAVGAWMFLRERLNRRGAAGIVLSIGGVVLLSLTGPAQEAAPSPVLGNLLELAAMVSGAGSALAIKRLSPRYDALFLTGMQAAVGCVFFLPFFIAAGPAEWGDAPMSAWLSVVYLGSFVSLGSWGLYNSALVHMPAGKAALTVNLIPGIALLAGWALRGEAISLVQLGACAVIVAAVVFAETGRDAGNGSDARIGGDVRTNPDVQTVCDAGAGGDASDVSLLMGPTPRTSARPCDISAGSPDAPS